MDTHALLRELLDLERDLEPLAGGWGDLQLRGAARQAKIKRLRDRRTWLRDTLAKRVGAWGYATPALPHT